MSKQKKCKHKWRAVARSGYTSVQFKCGRCNKIADRKMTRTEIKICKKDDKISLKKSQQLHKLFHEWLEILNKHKQGQELIEAAEKWAHKRKVPCSVVDDDHHCGSLLLIIPHETSDYYMGASVVHIPQCSSVPPSRFFLYPGPLVSMLKNIRVIHTLQEKDRGKPYRPKWEFFPRKAGKKKKDRQAVVQGSPKGL